MTDTRPTGADMRPLAYRIGVAAQMIGIGKSKMYELVKKGAISTRKVEGATIVLRSDLEAFLAALDEASASHQRPSPRQNTVCPCGRPHPSHRPLARPKRITAESCGQSIG